MKQTLEEDRRIRGMSLQIIVVKTSLRTCRDGVYMSWVVEWRFPLSSFVIKHTQRDNQRIAERSLQWSGPIHCLLTVIVPTCGLYEYLSIFPNYCERATVVLKIEWFHIPQCERLLILLEKWWVKTFILSKLSEDLETISSHSGVKLVSSCL